MSVVVPVAIPRWEWRTVAGDLSSLFRRVAAPVSGAATAEQVHLVCVHSSHTAVIEGETLELRWRKEIGPEGFELWDTILQVTAPFPREAVDRLWSAWELSGAAPRSGFASAAAFIDEVIVPSRAVVPVKLSRLTRETTYNGISCTMETLRIGPQTKLDSFAIEHEDPSLMSQVLADLGLDARDNTNVLQAVKRVLGLTVDLTRSQQWAGKSNASSS